MLQNCPALPYAIKLVSNQAYHHIGITLHTSLHHCVFNYKSLVGSQQLQAALKPGQCLEQSIATNIPTSFVMTGASLVPCTSAYIQTVSQVGVVHEIRWTAIRL